MAIDEIVTKNTLRFQDETKYIKIIETFEMAQGVVLRPLLLIFNINNMDQLVIFISFICRQFLCHIVI